MILLNSKKRFGYALSILGTILLLLSCGNDNRKERLENALNIIYVDSSQQIVDADELAGFFSKNRLAYEKTYNDSSIFITGSIQRIDKEHGEVLLRNQHGKDVVCVVKSDSTLQFLSRSDKVLFKGVCSADPGYGVVLILQCEIAQIRK